MQVCVVYAGKDREGTALRTIAQALAQGLNAQGHQTDVVNAYTDDTRLTRYDYVIIGSEPVSFFSARIPEILSKFLAQAGTVSGKRCLHL